MAYKSNLKAPPCPICKYNGPDYVYKTKEDKNRTLYHCCPFCWYRVEFGKMTQKIMTKLGLKINEENKILERVKNAKEEENRYNQGIEANSERNSNTVGGGETGGSSWNPFNS